jgi:hypothetical protein
MPKVEQSQLTQEGANVAPYGVAMNDNTKTFRERLMERFNASQFVRVKNIDDETFTWQYLPAENEEVSFTPDPMKITHRKPPEVWAIDAGKEDVLVGANAYLMIEGLYKKLAAKKTLATMPDEPGVARNFNFSDADAQERIINQIFQGIENPTFGTPVAAVSETVAPEPKKEATGVSK